MRESASASIARIQKVLLSQVEAESAAPHNRHELKAYLNADEASFTRASVLVGIVPRDHGLQVLLTKRTEHLRQHGGQISFPGGRMEASDADPFATALRESFEEIALPAKNVQLLGYLEPMLTITGYRVLPVVALLVPDYQAKADGVEVSELFEAPLQLFLNADNERPFEIEFRGEMRRLVAFDWQQHQIWGATASMLLNLRQRLQAAM